VDFKYSNRYQTLYVLNEMINIVPIIAIIGKNGASERG
jgi:hypothetical protein